MRTRPGILALLLSLSSLGAASVCANDRHDLMLEQQQDALDLAQRHHGLSLRRAEVVPADRNRIEQLVREQRLEQQRLEIDQWQRQRALERNAPAPHEDALRRRLDMQVDAFRTERQLQMLRFQAEQQRLMQSTTRQPLQPGPAPGTLHLR